MKPVPFFDQETLILPCVASREEFLNKPVSIAEFAGGRCVNLFETDNGDLLCQAIVKPYREVADFIQGPRHEQRTAA